MSQRRWYIAMVAATLCTLPLLIYLFSSPPHSDSDSAEPSTPAAANSPTARQSTDVVRDVAKAGQSHDSPSSISGVVKRFGTEEPVARANVTVKRKGNVVFDVVTDDAGRYAVAGLTPELVYIVTAEGLDPGWCTVERVVIELKPGEARDRVDIVIGQEAAIGGKVTGVQQGSFDERAVDAVRRTRDRYTNERDFFTAVHKALGSLRETPMPGLIVSLANGNDKRETTTDAAGEYHFEGLQPRVKFEITVALPDGAAEPAHIYSNRAGFSLEPGEKRLNVDFSFRLDGISVTGHVTDANARPIPGAHVVAECFGTRPGPALHGETDGLGQYFLSGLSPWTPGIASRYLLDGWQQSYGIPIYLIRAEAPGYVSPRIIVPPLLNSVVTAADALIEFQVKEESLIASPEPPEITTMPTIDGSTIKTIDFILEPEAVVSGMVVDTNGQAVGDVRVRLQLADPETNLLEALVPASPPPPEPIQVDARGGFRISGLAAGSYEFVVERDHPYQMEVAKNAPIDIRPGDAFADATVVVEALAPRGALAGVVLDETTRQRIEDFSVEIVRLEEVVKTWQPSCRLTNPAGPGTFQLDDVPPGLLTVRIKSPGRATQEATFEIKSDRISESKWKLESDGILFGRITHNGEPRYGMVKLTKRGGEHSPDYSENWSDEQGNYEINGLQHGSYAVEVRTWSSTDKERFAWRYEHAFVEIESSKRTRLDCDIRGDAVIRGKFTTSNPGLYCTVKVFLQSSNHNSEPRPEIDISCVATARDIDESGEFEIADLPAGTYVIVATCLGPVPDQIDIATVYEDSKTITLSAGKTSGVDFQF